MKLGLGQGNLNDVDEAGSAGYELVAEEAAKAAARQGDGGGH